MHIVQPHILQMLSLVQVGLTIRVYIIHLPLQVVRAWAADECLYSFNIKIHISGFSELLESIFCILPAVEAFPLQKVVEVVQEVVVSW